MSRFFVWLMSLVISTSLIIWNWRITATNQCEFENEAHELLGCNHTMTIVLYWDLFPLLGCFSFFIFSFTFGDGQLGERTINVLPISPPDHMTITFFSSTNNIGCPELGWKRKILKFLHLFWFSCTASFALPALYDTKDTSSGKFFHLHLLHLKSAWLHLNHPVLSFFSTSLN